MTIRNATYVGIAALLSQVLLVQGCGSNNPSTTPTGGTPATAGATAITPTGGTTATTPTGGATNAAGATATTSTGGTTAIMPTGGTTSAGGAAATAPVGGTTAAGGVTATTPVGGTTAAAGSTGTDSGGTTGAAGTTGASAFQPLCGNVVTALGVNPTKSGNCTATDPQLCYKTCGPRSSGFKSETCQGGVYVEQSGCSFPPGDYSCYKIPLTMDPTCPTTAPQANMSCSVAECVLCSDAAGGYLDSTGAAKTGYCVCPATTTGTGKWSCASSTAWPCPANQGC